MTSQQTVIGAQSLIGWAIVSAGASTTTYVGIGGPDLDVLDSFTEAQSQVAIRQAGTAQSLYVRVPYGTSAVTSNVLKLRQNGADTSLGVSWGKNTSGTFADTSDTVSLAAGDLICFRSTGDAGLNGPLAAAFAFVTTSQPSTIIGSTHVTLPSASTSYFSVGGPSGTETPARVYSLETATLSNLQANVASNAASGSTPVRLRKNGSNGNQSITVAASTTGLFEDTTHTDSLTAGDLWNFSGVTGGTGSVELSVTVKYLGAVANQVAYPTLGGGPSGDDVPQFIPPFGCYDATDSMGVAFDETGQVAASPTSFTVSLLTVLVAANNEPSGTLTVSARVNKANGNLSVSFSAGSTGAFQDTTHSDVLTAGDLFCWQVTDANGFGFDGTISALYTSRAPPTHYTQGCPAASTPSAAIGPAATRVAKSAAVTTPTGSLSRSIGAPRKATSNATAAVSRGVGHAVSATSTPAAAVVKGSTKALGSSTTAAAAVTRLYPRSYPGSTTPAAAVSKGVGKGQPAQTTAIGAVLRQAGKWIAGASTPATSIARQMASAHPAQTTPSAAVARSVSSTHVAQTSPAGAMARQVGKAQPAQTTPTAGVNRGLWRTVAAASAGVAGLIKSKAKNVASQTTPASTIARQVTSAQPAQTIPTASVRKGVARSLPALAPSIAGVTKFLWKLLVAQTTPTSAVSRPVVRAKAVAASTTPPATVSRQTSKTLGAAASPLAALRKGVSSALRAAAGSAAGVSAVLRTKRKRRRMTFIRARRPPPA